MVTGGGQGRPPQRGCLGGLWPKNSFCLVIERRQLFSCNRLRLTSPTNSTGYTILPTTQHPARLAYPTSYIKRAASRIQSKEDHFCNMETSFNSLQLPTKEILPTRILKSYETNDMTYEFTDTTFIKTSRLPFNDPFPDGTPFIWFRSW
jgi:hypothetical protein